MQKSNHTQTKNTTLLYYLHCLLPNKCMYTKYINYVPKWGWGMGLSFSFYVCLI